jgi:hypothetical protein
VELVVILEDFLWPNAESDQFEIVFIARGETQKAIAESGLKSSL